MERKLCICKYEPRGDHHLEGFLLNEKYYYEKEIVYGIERRLLFIKPEGGFEETYLGACSPKIFKKYFQDPEDPVEIKRIRTSGKKANKWNYMRKKLKEDIIENNGQRTCEVCEHIPMEKRLGKCWEFIGLNFAHRHTRKGYNGPNKIYLDDRNQWALACPAGHNVIDEPGNEGLKACIFLRIRGADLLPEVLADECKSAYKKIEEGGEDAEQTER